MNTLLKTFETFIHQRLQRLPYPGLAVAIVSNDQVHYVNGFGVKHLETQDPITTNTLFQVASISKPISATLLAILQKQQKLKLEDPVTRYLPHFHLNGAHAPATLAHLLSHSSGVPKEGFNDLIEAYTPRQELLAKLRSTPVAGEPGQYYSYNNAMFSVVEDVAEAATNTPFSQQLQEMLFDPLGMINASIGLQHMTSAKDKAYPHVQNDQGAFIPADVYSRGYYAVASAGGVNASLADLIPFVQLHLGAFPHVLAKEELEVLAQPRIIDHETAEWFNDEQKLTANYTYGLGWHLMTFANENVVFHGGWLNGFIHFLGYMPDHNIGIIVLHNCESKLPSTLALKFFELYLSQ